MRGNPGKIPRSVTLVCDRRVEVGARPHQCRPTRAQPMAPGARHVDTSIISRPSGAAVYYGIVWNDVQINSTDSFNGQSVYVTGLERMHRVSLSLNIHWTLNRILCLYLAYCFAERMHSDKVASLMATFSVVTVVYMTMPAHSRRKQSNTRCQS